jgi:hypothetical protein
LKKKYFMISGSGVNEEMLGVCKIEKKIFYDFGLATGDPGVRTFDLGASSLPFSLPPRI